MNYLYLFMWAISIQFKILFDTHCSYEKKSYSYEPWLISQAKCGPLGVTMILHEHRATPLLPNCKDLLNRLHFSNHIFNCLYLFLLKYFAYYIILTMYFFFISLSGSSGHAQDASVERWCEIKWSKHYYNVSDQIWLNFIVIARSPRVQKLIVKWSTKNAYITINYN